VLSSWFQVVSWCPAGANFPDPRAPCRNRPATIGTTLRGAMDAIIVPCTKKKVWDASPNAGPVPAREAYTGPAFLTWRAFAEDSGSPWFILSTKYGLVEPLVAISNYNIPISEAEADPEFLERLRTQIAEFQIDLSDRVLVLDLERFEVLMRQAMGPASGKVSLHKILF
jgi:hypothetical protein